jgi:hypothetical protein
MRPSRISGSTALTLANISCTSPPKSPATDGAVRR